MAGGAVHLGECHRVEIMLQRHKTASRAKIWQNGCRFMSCANAFDRLLYIHSYGGETFLVHNVLNRVKFTESILPEKNVNFLDLPSDPRVRTVPVACSWKGSVMG